MPPRFENICVYAASSDAVDQPYLEAARALGSRLAAGGHTLIYGAGNIGLMGALGAAVHAGGGRVVGVIPEKLRGLELAYEDADELIITETMRERKAVMEDRADAFVALPGGFGTLEEIMEVLTLKQLRYHDKPLVFLNTRGIFSGLFSFFDELFTHRFVKDSQRALYHVADSPAAVFEYLDGYTPPNPREKWF